jgi:hypothetical protein
LKPEQWGSPLVQEKYQEVNARDKKQQQQQKYSKKFVLVKMCVIITRVFVYLGTFEKQRKATISFLTTVRPSVRPLETTRLPLEGF